MRNAEVERNTRETRIKLALNTDGNGVASIVFRDLPANEPEYKELSGSGDGAPDTAGCGVGFFRHMLTLFAVHSRFDLTLDCTGDYEVDLHHTAEDVGICLGEALRRALGDCRGITRYGNALIPMDEALALCAVDVSGRAVLAFNVSFPTEKIGAFDAELVREFFAAFVRASGVTLHIRLLDGQNSHHIAEAVFKGFAAALRIAVRPDSGRAGEIPSSKGMLV